MRLDITTIGMVIFNGFDALDVAAPHQIFNFINSYNGDLPLVKLFIIGPNKIDPICSWEGLKWTPDTGYGDTLTDEDGNVINDNILDLIFIPGGSGEQFKKLTSNIEDPGWTNHPP